MSPEQLDVLFAASMGFTAWKVWRSRRTSQPIGDPVLPPVGREGVWDAFWHPKREPLLFGDAITDFFETHARVIAMSGGYKTTLLAQITRQRLEAGRSVVVLTGGDSLQLEEEIKSFGGYVIRPETSPISLNCFEGPDAFKAQTWAQLFPTDSVAKVFHGAFELAALKYFKGEPSPSLAGLKAYVLNYEPEEESSRQLWKGMKEGYVTIRMARVEEFLGHFVGDQLSISYCMKNKIPLMFVVDSRFAPDLNELAAALVWQGICYAVTTVGDLDAIVDEFARLPEELVKEEIRTWRFRKAHLVAASHRVADFPESLEDMFHVNALGRMVASATETRKAASDITWGTVHPTGFGAHALGERRNRLDDLIGKQRRGYFWMVDQTRVQEVKVLQYTSPTRYATAKRLPGLAATLKQRPIRQAATGIATTAGGPVPLPLTPTVVGVRDPMCGPPMMPSIFGKPFATDREMDIWLKHRFPEGIEGCWELDYYANPKTGRPEMQWRGSPYKPFSTGKFVPGVSGGNSWMAYMVVLALWEIYDRGWVLDSKEAADYLWELKEQTVRMGKTVGHRDTGEDLGLCRSKKCGRREHLKWSSNRENVAEQNVLALIRRKGAVA
jgi:hypothetical protein